MVEAFEHEVFSGGKIHRESIGAHVSPLLTNGCAPIRKDFALSNRSLKLGVRDRLIMIVAIDQHRENAGDGALPTPGPARSSSLGNSVNTVGV